MPGEIALDLRHLSDISLHTDPADGAVYVEAGAGSTVDQVLDYLERHGGYTLPTYGMVGKQTIAGAISTATHGSGRSSLSHYVDRVTAAGYDPSTGAARVFEWTDGEDLLAARCGVGCAGIVLSIRMRVQPDWLIEERAQWFTSLDQVLAAARDYPRTQFYLIPWSWRWYAQLRRPVAGDSPGSPGLVAHALRGFRLVVIDMALNGAIRGMAGGAMSLRAIPWSFRWLLPGIAPPGVRVRDRSRELLTMRHDLFRHVECELFVPASQVAHSAAYVEWVLQCCRGEPAPLPAELAADRFGCDVTADVHPLRGRYLHDYPITFRSVLRDDTLISMTSGDRSDVWYSISLITYQRDHSPFMTVMRFLTRTMARAYGARPHWGKVCTLTTEEAAMVYPDLPRFRAHCQRIDPDQVFVNDFTRRVLGFTAEGRPDSAPAD